MEEMEGIEGTTPRRHYKVEVGDYVIIHKKTFGEYNFYSINLGKKKPDGQYEYYPKSVMFKKGTDLEDGTRIRILDFFEDVRKNKRDLYNPIWSLFILDYEIIQTPSEGTAFEDFQNSLDSEEINIDSDALPF